MVVVVVVVVVMVVVMVTATQFFPSPVDEVKPGWHEHEYNVPLSSLPEQNEFFPH